MTMDDECVLIDQKQLAEMLSISRRTVQRMISRGKLPAPIRIGKMVRWKLQDIKKWIANGCRI